MTQLGMIAAVAKGVMKAEGLKFVGAELVEVAFVSKEDMLAAVEKGMKIGNVVIPVRRCLGMEEEIVVMEVLEIPIMDRKATIDGVKLALKPWGGVFQVKLLEWLGTSIRTGTAVAMVLLKAGQRMGKDWVGKALVGGRSCVIRRKAEVGSTPIVGSVLNKTQIVASVPEAAKEAESVQEKILTAGAEEELVIHQGRADTSMVMGSCEDSEGEDEEILGESNKTILMEEEEIGITNGVLKEIDDTGDEENDDSGKLEMWEWLEGKMHALAETAVAERRPLTDANWKALQQVDRIVEPLLRCLEEAMNDENSVLSDRMRLYGE